MRDCDGILMGLGFFLLDKPIFCLPFLTDFSPSQYLYITVESLTEEEKRDVLDAEKREMEAFNEQRKQEKLEAKRRKDRERKEKMAKPIDPLPE